MPRDDLEALAQRSQRELQALAALLRDAEATTRAAIDALEGGAGRLYRARSARRQTAAVREMVAAVERSVEQFRAAATLARAVADEARRALDALAHGPAPAPRLAPAIAAIEAEARRLAREADALLAQVAHLRARGQLQRAGSL